MLDFAGGLVEIASRFGNGRGNGGGYRGDEGGVDLLVDGGGTGVGDFRRDRVLLLVDVILDFLDLFYCIQLFFLLLYIVSI